MMIYAVLHNYCIYESSAETVSLHKTLCGAWKAKHKLQWDAEIEERENHIKYGYPRRGEYWLSIQWWGIKKFKIV
jgi:hypothetical protein